MKSVTSRYLAPILGVTIFLGVWELFVRAFHVKSYKLPRPSEVIAELGRHGSIYAKESVPSIVAMVSGLVLAFAVAGLLASVLAHWPFVERAVTPIAVFVQVTPLFAWVIPALLWIGYGYRSLIVLIAVVCFPPFLMNLTAGLRDVDPNALELLTSVNASRFDVFRRLRVPSAIPQFLSALKVSSGLALVGVAIVEAKVITLRHGIGVLLYNASTRGNDGVPQLWGCIFVLGLIGSFAYVAISGIERAALRWHSSSAGSRR